MLKLNMTYERERETKRLLTKCVLLTEFVNVHAKKYYMFGTIIQEKESDHNILKKASKRSVTKSKTRG